jgi:phosphopantothenoylcysteine decarboxylase/phosphopantothenate--cysteine ligase
VLCRSLLIGVTGSVAAISIPGYCQFFRRGLVEIVRVIMTESATRLVPPATMQAYSGQPVFVDSFEGTAGFHVPHIQLTRDADVFVIMPASANIIAKAAHGIADDLLSTAIVASAAPVVIVPCMNEIMWFNKAVQRNVELARSHGYHVLEPAHGIEVADMQPTFGVMPPLEQIIEHLARVIAQKPRPS